MNVADRYEIQFYPIQLHHIKVGNKTAMKMMYQNGVIICALIPVDRQAGGYCYGN